MQETFIETVLLMVRSHPNIVEDKFSVLTEQLLELHRSYISFISAKKCPQSSLKSSDPNIWLSFSIKAFVNSIVLLKKLLDLQKEKGRVAKLMARRNMIKLLNAPKRSIRKIAGLLKLYLSFD